MNNSFNINTSFNNIGFEKSIDEYNKIFSNNLNQNNAFLEEGQNFADVFSAVGTKNQMAPMQLNAQYNVGLDSINAQKIENLSDSAKLANDIGTGFSKSLSELSATEKQAEHAFETFASGGDISVHDVMIASQKSNLAMQMAIQLRNQMLNAYNEFKNMSI